MSTDNKTTSDHALRVATAYHEAWTSGDLDKAMSFMTDDVVVHAPGKEINGKEEWGAWCFSDWGSFSSRESIG